MKVRLKSPDAIVRDPHTLRPLAGEGGEVPDTSFWRRRVLDGDVELVEVDGEPTGLEPVTPLTTRARGGR